MNTETKVNYKKYPRSHHLPWSESKTDDDRTLSDCSHFIGKRVIVTLKMDGENTSIYSNGYVHARSIDGNPHFTQNWVRNLAAQITHGLPMGWRLCGENLFAKHSIVYENLDTFFYIFSIWNEDNVCLSWDETIEWVTLLDCVHVPVIFDGIFDEDLIKESFKTYKTSHEGYVIRLADSFQYDQFETSLAKFVRKNHVQTSNHWKHEKIEKNKLKQV